MWTGLGTIHLYSPLYSITGSSGVASASELTFFARHHSWWEFAFYGDSSGRSSECRVQGRPFTSQRLIPYMSQLLLLGKFEYSGGPIFKVVLEC